MGPRGLQGDRGIARIAEAISVQSTPASMWSPTARSRDIFSPFRERHVRFSRAVGHTLTLRGRLPEDAMEVQVPLRRHGQIRPRLLASF